MAAASLFGHATTVECPQLAATLNAMPAGTKLAAKPGGKFRVMVTVMNTGSTDVEDAGLRITLPFSLNKMSASTSPIGGSKSVRGVTVAPPSSLYWTTFPLKAKKKIRFKLAGALSPCQEVGFFQLEAAAYLAGRNCSSTALPSKKVRIG